MKYYRNLHKFSHSVMGIVILGVRALLKVVTKSHEPSRRDSGFRLRFKISCLGVRKYWLYGQGAGA